MRISWSVLVANKIGNGNGGGSSQPNNDVVHSWEKGAI
jgi:hypothetical protein